MKEKIITKKILKWYDLNKRSLPWRKKVSLERKQYYTLVSEFMLQQTQVTTVIPFFNRFIKDLPSINSLAKVKEKKLILGGIQLGIAMQLTNISRDVAEDLKMNRVYLPKSMRSYKSNEKERIFRNKSIKKQLSKDLLVLLKKAELFYENSWISIIKLKKKYGIPISIAAELYRKIGKKIIQLSYFNYLRV